MLSVTGLCLAVSTHAKALTDLPPRRLVRRSCNSREACWRADRSNKASSAPACPLMFVPNMTCHRYPASRLHERPKISGRLVSAKFEERRRKTTFKKNSIPAVQVIYTQNYRKCADFLIP